LSNLTAIALQSSAQAVVDLVVDGAVEVIATFVFDVDARTPNGNIDGRLNRPATARALVQLPVRGGCLD
jgi:hypothetical protein